MQFTNLSRNVSLLIVGLGLAVNGYSQSFLTNGLVGYWPFSGNANDASGNVNNGTTHGTTLTGDRFGNDSSACYFDGSGTYVGVPDIDSLDVTNMTLAFWFRLDSPDTARELVNKIGAIGTQSLSFGSEYSGSDGTVGFRICTDGWYDTLTTCPSTTVVAMGTWYHFAGTYDGSQMRIFINGVLENSIPKTGAIYNSTEDVKIGRYGYYSGWVYQGVIDDVRIYNAALSSNEVQQLYAYESLPSHPIVSLRKAVSPSFSSLYLGTNYQLQVSSDLKNWTNQGSPFTPTNSVMDYPQYFDVNNWNSLYFRLQESP